MLFGKEMGCADRVSVLRQIIKSVRKGGELFCLWRSCMEEGSEGRGKTVKSAGRL